MKNSDKQVRRVGLLVLIAFFALAAKEALAEEAWSPGDPDGATALYIGKTTEKGCQVLTYKGFEDSAEIAAAFGVREELVLFADRLDDAGRVQPDKWILVPGKDCGEVDWDKVDPKPDMDQGRIDGMRPLFYFLIKAPFEVEYRRKEV